MKIVVTYKWAADYQETSVGADGRVDWSRARPVVSDYDAVAMEVARQLSESTSGEAIGLTAGGPEVASAMALKTALARGLDRGIAVADETLASAGTARYAQVLARAIERIGGVDLVLAGDSSIDVAAKMVHVLVAGHLGWTRHETAYDDLDIFSRGMAAMETKAHLELLVARGLATRSEGADGVVTFAAAG